MSKIRFLLAVAVGAALIAGTPAFAQSKPVKVIRPDLIQAALDGDAIAQLSVGLAFYSDGETQDYEKAAKFLTLSAEQGNAMAQHRLGLMDFHGQGVAEDLAKAWKLWTQSAELGNPDSQRKLAFTYSKTGKHDQAFHWYLKLAEQPSDHLAEAQFQVGLAYFKGEGVEQDYAHAFKWLRKAADSSEAAAYFYLGYSYQDGLGVAQNYQEPFVGIEGVPSRATRPPNSSWASSIGRVKASRRIFPKRPSGIAKPPIRETLTGSES